VINLKNSLINKLSNTITIKIKGKNIERFIKRLISIGVELLNIKYLKYNEIIIKVKKEDLERIEEVKTIYELEVIDINGIDKVKHKLIESRYIILGLIISIFLLLYLSNTIFSVEVIHNDPNLRNLIIKELKQDGIEKYKQKKTYEELQNIKKRMLEKYKDKIEWLEILAEGTKYIVRVEERMITKEDNNYKNRNIVAKKDAMIVRVEAKTGEIVKTKNSYVKKGEVIISGNINLNEEIKDKVMAEGTIYGEVWYKATVEYPLKYREETLTGKQKKVFVIKIFNYEFSLFDFKKFKNKKVKEKIIIKHNFLPISLVTQQQSELNVVDETLTKDKAIKKATEKAKYKIESKLNEKEYIIDTKKLKVEQNNSKIILELFFSVCEDITDYEEIIEEEILQE